MARKAARTVSAQERVPKTEEEIDKICAARPRPDRDPELEEMYRARDVRRAIDALRQMSPIDVRVFAAVLQRASVPELEHVQGAVVRLLDAVAVWHHPAARTIVNCLE
jgi:hypothetical protein